MKSVSGSMKYNILILIALVLMTVILVDYGLSLYEKSLESGLRDTAIAQASFIQSVAEFDAIYSQDDVGASASDATVYQLDIAFQNLASIDSGYQHILADPNDLSPFILSTQYEAWELPTLHRKIPEFHGLLPGTDSRELGVHEVFDGQRRRYLVDVRPIHKLDMYLYTYLDITNSNRLANGARILVPALVAAVYLLLTLMYNRAYVADMTKLTQEYEALDRFYQFENHGLWRFDVNDNEMTIPKKFLLNLGEVHDEDRVYSRREYETYIHPNDVQNFRFMLNEVLYNQMRKYEIVYRFRNAEGDYRLILSSCYVHESDEEGYPSIIKGINVLIDQASLDRMSDVYDETL